MCDAGKPAIQLFTVVLPNIAGGNYENLARALWDVVRGARENAPFDDGTVVVLRRADFERSHIPMSCTMALAGEKFDAVELLLTANDAVPVALPDWGSDPPAHCRL